MKKIFIDLEETIINDIDAIVPMWRNINKIKRFIENEKPDSVETFSFALLGKHEKGNWEWIKKEIGIEMSTQTFEIDVLKLEFLRAMLGKVERNEMMDFLSFTTKDRVFEWMIQKNFSSGDFVLIDDMVKTHTLITKNGGMTIRVINVAEL